MLPLDRGLDSKAILGRSLHRAAAHDPPMVAVAAFSGGKFDMVMRTVSL